MMTCCRKLGLVLVTLALCLSAAAQSPYVKVTGVLQGPNGLPAANQVISLTPTQTFFVANSGANTCAYDYFFQINGVTLIPCDIVNFNATTPAAPTNGINVTFATSRAVTTDSVTAALIGDGNVGHCLSGIGTWVACSGAGGVTGSGTTGTIAIWTSSSALGNSTITHSGTVLSFSDQELDITGQNSGASHIAANNSSNDIKLQTSPGSNSAGAYLEVSTAAGLGAINLVPYNFNASGVFQVFATSTVGWMYPPTTNFAGLSSILSAGAATGATVFCTNCTVGSHPCTNSGAGTLAAFNGTAWNCI